MNNNRIGICIFLSLAALLTSCMEEIDHVEVTKKAASDYIVFGGATANDVILTRGGSVSAPKFSEKVLTSESADVSLPLFVKVEQGINNSGPATRAAITTTIGDITQLDAWGTRSTYADAGKTQVTNRELFFFGSDGKAETGALFTKETGNEDINGDGAIDDIFYPDGNGPYLWDKSASSVSDFSFVTVSPAGSGFKAVINPATLTVTFDYEVPASAADQKDILVAVPDPVPVNYGAPVPLDYKHVMAAVNVKVGEKMPAGVIKSIKFTGVYDKASYYPATNEWTNRSIKENGGEFSVTLPEGGLAVGPGGAGAESEITSEETSFMMIPQQLFTGAEIVVEFHDNTTNKDVTLRASIQGDVWERNTTTNYLINIDANYNISIVPLDRVLDSHYIITKVEVSSEFPYWDLMAQASDGASVTVLPEAQVNPMAKQGFWTDKIASKDANGNYYVPANAESARGDYYCRGVQGEGQIVYVFIPENVSGETRTITLSIAGSGAGAGTKTLTLTQEPVVWMDPTGAGETYWGCELLLEGGQVPWGFCWDGITEEYITTQGNQISVPGGQLKHVTDRLEAAGFDVNQMYDPNFYINLVQKSNNNQGWLLQIDYSRIGNIEVADDPSDGESNTRDLYYFDGISTLAALKEFIANQDNIQYTMDSGEVEITNTLDFAAMYAIKRNRFHLYDDGQGLLIPVIEEKDINWYLPAKDQFPVFMNTNWGQSFTFKDLFWTSTAYLSETDTDNAHSYAYLNGIETISHRNDPYLTFALRRYTISSEVEIPINPDDVIKPGDDISGGGTGGGGTGNEGGDIEGGTKK